MEGDVDAGSFRVIVCLLRHLADGAAIMHEELLTRAEAANYLGVSHSTLARWACCREKLRYHRIGKRALYRKSDLDDFIAGSAVEPVGS